MKIENDEQLNNAVDAVTNYLVEKAIKQTKSNEFEAGKKLIWEWMDCKLEATPMVKRLKTKDVLSLSIKFIIDYPHANKMP